MFNIPTEAQEQEALFAWARLNENQYPELGLMFHVPNGSYKSIASARKFRREGLRAGVPDICLPIGRNGFNALYIELKRIKGGKVSEDQKSWIEALNEAGNKAVVCRGWEKAAEVIKGYLS